MGASICPVSRPAPTSLRPGTRNWAPRHRRLLWVQAKPDRKSTRLNSSHGYISYAVFCLKKKKEDTKQLPQAQTLGHTPTSSVQPPNQYVSDSHADVLH